MGGLNRAFQGAVQNFQGQGGLEGLLANPSFRAGAGLLSPGEGQSGIEAALGGIASASDFKKQQKQQKQQQKLQDAINQILQANGQAQPPAVPGAPPTLPPGISGPVGPSPTDPGALIQQQPPVNVSPGAGTPIPPVGAPPQAAAAPTPPPQLQQLNQALLQYGNPQQQQAALSQLGQNQRFDQQQKSAKERFEDQVRREEERFDREKGRQGNRVRATKELADGRLVNIYDDRTEVVQVDGEDVRAKTNQQVVKNADGSISLINKRTGQTEEVISQQDATKGRVQDEVARQTAKIQTAGQLAAAKALPGIRQTSQETLNLVNQIKNAKGLETSVGGFQGRAGIFNPYNLGPDNIKFNAMLDQLTGKVFLKGFEALKGGGTVTEMEGQKAEKALARLDKAQKEEDFIEALNEFEQSIKNALSVAEQEAGINEVDPELNSRLDRYRQ